MNSRVFMARTGLNEALSLRCPAVLFVSWTFCISVYHTDTNLSHPITELSPQVVIHFFRRDSLRVNYHKEVFWLDDEVCWRLPRQQLELSNFYLVFSGLFPQMLKLPQPKFQIKNRYITPFICFVLPHVPVYPVVYLVVESCLRDFYSCIALVISPNNDLVTDTCLFVVCIVGAHGWEHWFWFVLDKTSFFLLTYAW